MPVDTERTKQEFRGSVSMWEGWSGGLCCLFPRNDEGEACAVFCLPGLSSSLHLASSPSVKSQAPVLDSKFQDAKQSSIVQLKENRISPARERPCQWLSLHTRQTLKTNRTKLWYPDRVLHCWKKSPAMFSGNCGCVAGGLLYDAKFCTFNSNLAEA